MAPQIHMGMKTHARTGRLRRRTSSRVPGPIRKMYRGKSSSHGQNLGMSVKGISNSV